MKVNKLKTLLSAIALTATLSTAAQRIVSLVPSATYALEQIGAGYKVVGRTSYCPKSNASAIVGDAISTNIESIVALNPNTVIASNFTKQSTRQA